MGASAETLPQNQASIGIGQLAAALPSDLSHAPVLGILGVTIGAGLVTLASRLLSLGLADLKGHLGISFDDGAWINTAFNAALIFIGPFTVYLGGLLGPRTVLLFAAGAFTLISALLPLIHSYSLLVTALVLAGLTSGTFYPLTLTFALRNIPLRFLPFTLALYATSVDGAVNAAPSLYGFFRDHLSWRWMFWASAVIAPVMMVLIYYGIPPSPARPRSEPAPSFAAFLFGSLGFAFLFMALDQGERLDWWRSGLFVALFTVGTFFLLGALMWRLRGPNPLVAMSFLGKWNTLLLGSELFLFRFTLLATIILIPQSLAIHGFEADQIAPALIWTVVPLLPIAFLIALLLLKNIDSRLIMAIGFAATALACWLNAGLTSAWAAPNFYRTELLTGVGQSFAFIGLVSTIVLQAIFGGALAKPQWVLTFSAFFHLVRLFGGSAGAVFMSHFIAQREKLHSNLLGLHVQSGDWVTDLGIHQMTAGLFPRSAGVAAATGRAVDIVAARLRLQAYTLTFIDGFYLVAWVCVLGLVLCALIRRSPLSYGDLARIQDSVVRKETT
jgi:DHA2 family multidrug resistance protein